MPFEASARALLVTCVAFLLSGIAAAGDTWTTLQGQKIEGPLRGVYGEFLTIGLKRGSITLAVNDLDDASLLKVAGFLAAPVAPPVPWSRTQSRLGKSLAGNLQILKDGKLVSYDPGDRPEPEFYLVYYDAFWCGPCRRFSPRLVEVYHALKQVTPDRFEVIFVSDDTDAWEQVKYANEVHMPWPILRFHSVRDVPIFEKWRASGIPSLVVLTRDGDLLFHSYRGEEYLGADDPLEKFATLLVQMQTGTAQRHQESHHRLAIAQHLHAAAGGNLAPKPYLVSIAPALANSVSVREFTAKLAVDARGRVADVEFSPQLDAVPESELRHAAESWLFLPAVVNGQAKATSVDLPIDLGKVPAAH